MRRTPTRALALEAALVASLVLAGTQTASAHVTVQPPSATQGSYAKLTFRVPNERPDAAAVQLRVQLPVDHPFASVSVKPLPGWTAELTTRTLDAPVEREGGAALTEAVSTITWSGGRIEPGQFQEFEVSVGPLPTDATSLSFPAIQTYSSGEEVAWIQVPEEGQPEPDRPAPTLTLTDAGTGVDHHGSSTEDGTSSGDEAAAAASHDSGTSGVAVAALLVAIVAAVLGAGALVVAVRGRRP